MSWRIKLSNISTLPIVVNKNNKVDKGDSGKKIENSAMYQKH